LTADKLIGTAGSTTIRVSQSLSLTGGTTYRYSIFAKAAEYTTLRATRTNVNLNTFSHDYDLAAGTASGGGAIELLANGWYRCSGSVVCNTTAAVGVFFTASPGSTGDGTSGLFLWGAQLEAASFASSYVKTEAAAATRAADQVEASLAGVAYPLSLYTEFVRNGDTGAAEGVFQVDASSRAQRANINVSSTDTLSVTARGGANDGDAAVAGAISVGAITKGAGRIEVDNVQAARAGSLATADTTASVPTASPDTVRFGDFSSTATYGFNYLRRAAIILRALSDNELTAISS
jgi:hypothetical protein